MKKCPICNSDMIKKKEPPDKQYPMEQPPTGFSATFPASGASAPSDMFVSRKSPKEYFVCKKCGHKSTVCEIALDKLNEIVSRATFSKDGDIYEKEYAHLFKKNFLNCQIFWKHFIVPITKRIESGAKDPVSHRDNISLDLLDIAYLYYSIFLNMVCAYEHKQATYLNKRPKGTEICSFEDFYVHLGSTLDLLEQMLLKIYVLILECRKQKSPLLPKLSEKEFLNKAKKWYENSYLKVYDKYYKKGVFRGADIYKIEEVLAKYYKNNAEWKDYCKFRGPIKECRNVIVHCQRIGRILWPMSKATLVSVPKKDKIRNYKRWIDVFNVHRFNLKEKTTDFIGTLTQMNSDFTDTMKILNKLWEKPIEDLRKLLLEDQNKIMLKKCNLNFT